jgi:hypothetical protein
VLAAFTDSTKAAAGSPHLTPDGLCTYYVKKDGRRCMYSLLSFRSVAADRLPIGAQLNCVLKSPTQQYHPKLDRQLLASPAPGCAVPGFLIPRTRALKSPVASVLATLSYAAYKYTPTPSSSCIPQQHCRCTGDRREERRTARAILLLRRAIR